MATTFGADGQWTLLGHAQRPQLRQQSMEPSAVAMRCPITVCAAGRALSSSISIAAKPNSGPLYEK